MGSGLGLDCGVDEAIGCEATMVAGDGEETGPMVVFVAQPVSADAPRSANHERDKIFGVEMWIFMVAVIRR